MPPAIQDRPTHDGGDQQDPDPAADAERGTDAVPHEQPEEDLAEDAGLGEADAAGGDATADRLQTCATRTLLGRQRLGRLVRPLLQQIVVARHQPTPFCSSSRSSRSFLLTRFGTWMRTRASTSPLPEPLRRGAPRPLIRSSLPSSEPAGILRDTVPSGVGTSTLPPSAAVGNETGTWTIRSSPRRSYVGEGSTRVTTIRSPFGPPCWPASPFPLSRIFVPSLTPGLILTVNVRRRRSPPVPWHF